MLAKKVQLLCRHARFVGGGAPPAPLPAPPGGGSVGKGGAAPANPVELLPAAPVGAVWPPVPLGGAEPPAPTVTGVGGPPAAPPPPPAPAAPLPPDAFDPAKVARFSERDVARLMRDPGIVRNKLKIRSAIGNARAFLALQDQHGSFDAWIWRFVGGKPIRGNVRGRGDIPARTPLSDALSRELKGRGFNFVGSTILYAFMQAGGLVNDHTVGCFRRAQVAALAKSSR